MSHPRIGYKSEKLKVATGIRVLNTSVAPVFMVYSGRKVRNTIEGVSAAQISPAIEPAYLMPVVDESPNKGTPLFMPNGVVDQAGGCK